MLGSRDRKYHCNSVASQQVAGCSYRHRGNRYHTCMQAEAGGIVERE